jgi:hypothetical protein
VFARYYTNADRDSIGRASLVYDVVALSDADFAAIGNDPFAVLPPLAEDRRPERFGELPIPSLAARSEATTAARLAELLRSEDQAMITVLLGALLAGDRVLSVANTRVETVECLTLLLPPWLRPALTFQVPTVDFPKHTPRLTVAERAHALLVEREWTAVLPRDAADPRLAEATSTAARLVALGRIGDRLPRAWATGSTSGAAMTDLGAAVAAILRIDLLHEGLRQGDVRRAVLVAARAETDDERMRLAEALFTHSSADRVAAALADVVRGEQRGAWSAVQAVSLAVGATRDRQLERFGKFFTTLLDGLHGASTSADEVIARSAQVTLACGAAALDDLERFLDIADPALPWESAWQTGAARWVKGRSQVARLFDALAAKGASYVDAVDAVQAIASVTTTGTGRSRERASAIGMALVRRTLRERSTLEPPDRIAALVDAVVRIWSFDSASTPGGTDAERAIRRLFGVGDTTAASSDPRRMAAELSRTIADAPDGGETELLGWLIAALDRSRTGALGEIAVRTVAAILEEQRRLAPHSEISVQIGRTLLHFAGTDAAFVFRPAWLDVVRQVDDVSRRELLARALAWVARGYASGRFTVGTLVDACVASGAEGGVIDDATVALLVPHLAAAARARANPVEIALLTATAASVATPNAAERLMSALLGSVPDDVADSVRMRRLALALQEIEHVRDEDRYAEARAALRRVLARATLSSEEEQALRVFLGVDDRTVIGRVLSRLPSRTPAGAAGDRK